MLYCIEYDGNLNILYVNAMVLIIKSTCKILDKTFKLTWTTFILYSDSL